MAGSCSCCTGFRVGDTGQVRRFERVPDRPDRHIVEIEPVGVAGFEGFHAQYPHGDFGKLLPCDGRRSEVFTAISRLGCDDIIHARFRTYIKHFC